MKCYLCDENTVDNKNVFCDVHKRIVDSDVLESKILFTSLTDFVTPEKEEQYLSILGVRSVLSKLTTIANPIITLNPLDPAISAIVTAYMFGIYVATSKEKFEKILSKEVR